MDRMLNRPKRLNRRLGCTCAVRGTQNQEESRLALPVSISMVRGEAIILHPREPALWAGIYLCVRSATTAMYSVVRTFQKTIIDSIARGEVEEYDQLRETIDQSGTASYGSRYCIPKCRRLFAEGASQAN
jgi:hypothetical protein